MIKNLDRRLFFEQMVPACATGCLALQARMLFAQPPQEPRPSTAVTHKYDAEIPVKVTRRLAFRMQYALEFIPLTFFLSKTMGHEKAMEMLQKFGAERSAEGAAESVKRLGGNDFAALKKLFSADSPSFQGVLTMSVTESTEKVHQLKVTECLYASTFRAANAGDQGFAAVCYGDYAFAKAFNPQLEMDRDQTLMQGHSCCKHRYLLKSR